MKGKRNLIAMLSLALVLTLLFSTTPVFGYDGTEGYDIEVTENLVTVENDPEAVDYNLEAEDYDLAPRDDTFILVAFSSTLTPDMVGLGHVSFAVYVNGTAYMTITTNAAGREGFQSTTHGYYTWRVITPAGHELAGPGSGSIGTFDGTDWVRHSVHVPFRYVGTDDNGNNGDDNGDNGGNGTIVGDDTTTGNNNAIVGEHRGTSPQTGDTPSVLPYTSLALISLGILSGANYFRRKGL